ncbi:MAG: macro domain-containing protein, partial [Planctomycetota bacterium]
METVVHGVRLLLKQGDLTLETTDAIVNAANASLMGGAGVDGAIHARGGRAILDACMEIRARSGPLATGKAVITTGGDLSACRVIHTVGPIWTGGGERESRLLRDCYTNSLALCLKQGIRSVAFPSISTGAYGYPVQEAAPVALSAVVDFLTH